MAAIEFTWRRWRPSLAGGILALAVTCMLVSDGFAQSKEAQFDVVSIRSRVSKGGGSAPGAGNVYLPGGWFRDPGVKLQTLIAMAYNLQSPSLTIIDLPKWAEDVGYAIEGKAGPDYPKNVSAKENEANIKEMLRSMLADRFHLKLHREVRKTKVLVLRVKPGVMKLTPVAAPIPPDKEGRFSFVISDQNGGFSGKTIKISTLCTSLALFLKQRVEDRTGLEGYYDFKEKWVTPRGPNDPELADDKVGPDGLAQLISYLDQKLGLIFRSEEMPADFWVVDHVETPSEN